MSEDRFAALKRKVNKTKLIEVYTNFAADPARHSTAFWEAMLGFFHSRMHRLEVSFHTLGTAETADDWAQQATLKMWKALPKFMANPKSTPELFVRWISRIAKHKRIDATKYLLKQQREKVGLTVKMLDESDGNEYEESNPEIYKRWHFEGSGYVSSPLGPEKNDADISELLLRTHGVDFEICSCLARPVVGEDGFERPRTYGEAARDLNQFAGHNLTESSIKQRMAKMKLRLGNEDAAKKERVLSRRNTRWAAMEAERKGGPARGLDALREQKARAAQRTDTLREEEMLEAKV